MSSTMATLMRQAAEVRREIAMLRPAPPAPSPDAIAAQLGVTLDGWQSDVLTSTSRNILMLCSRQAGKSFTASLLAIQQVLRKSGSRIIVISESERQSKLLLETVSHNYKQLANVPPLTVDNVLSLEFANGGKVFALPGSEDTVRGFSSIDLLVEDEAGVVSDTLYYTVRPMTIVSRGTMVLLGTPKGKRGHLYDAFESGGARWHRTVIKATDIPHRIDPAELAEYRKMMPDFWFRQEFLCEFVDLEDQYFATDLVDAAMSDRIVPIALPAFPEWAA